MYLNLIGHALIPLRDMRGNVRTYALVDACDAHHTAHRWCLNTDGYATRMLPKRERRPGRTAAKLHREILGLEAGDRLEADHLNGNRLDCRRSNLRVVTKRQNKQNLASYRGARSSYRGVSWLKGKWTARVRLNGTLHYLGSYDTEERAAEVAQAFRVQHMPFTNEARSGL